LFLTLKLLFHLRAAGKKTVVQRKGKELSRWNQGGTEPKIQLYRPSLNLPSGPAAKSSKLSGERESRIKGRKEGRRGQAADR